MTHTKPICWTIALATAVLIAAPGPEAYTLKATKWSTLQVPFYVNAQNLDVSEPAAVAAILFGASAWTNQTNTAFSFYYAGSTAGSSAVNNGKNEIFFRDASNGSAIATTYTWSSGSRTIDTDVVFWDGAFTFFTGSSGCSTGLYVEDIATHEFGHALGLGHSLEPGATMSASLGYCAIDMRWLAEDDKQGVEYLYPSGVANTPPVATISSPSSGSVVEGTVLTFAGSATDAEDGDLAARLVWLSSIDGQIGTGPSFQRSLSVGAHAITARATDTNGATAEAQRSVTVEAKTSVVQSGVIALTGSPAKSKGLQRADLVWSGATSSSIDIYRDGQRLATTGNTGKYTDAINQRGAGAYMYQICHAGTSTCSNQARVAF